MAVKLSVAHRSRPKEGEVENGDGVLVRREGPYTLIAVVDALGHGAPAAHSSAVAVGSLSQVLLATGVDLLMEAVHASLRHVRGAAAMLALFDGQVLHCAGVGNVELRSQGTRVPVLPTPGILGQSYRSLRTVSTKMAPGDRLVVFSDGLSFRLDLESVRMQSPEEACALLLERYGRLTDDATVLVADVES
ncbi:serine/threonine-protein phosphatase [Myxococcus sp. K15C18031901]|uniref:SpoIIE family protein phosphatase n=1 Tax=Myxococcus dinghuensis TaxID=2906761 RepID=UPI0020A83195|nr:SpoIIE family protein phosphatase [Myxococcus dinghuensis]MCP3101808.1 serine/threonine-protein phosphatase [Myxococcus dinghuensis]